MSEQENRKGKVKEFTRGRDETIEEYFARFYCYKKCNFEEVECTDALFENFDDDFYKEAVYANGNIYMIIEDVEVEDVDYGSDIFEATNSEDGTISYILSFYDGGCSFSEALEEALKKLS